MSRVGGGRWVGEAHGDSRGEASSRNDAVVPLRWGCGSSAHPLDAGRVSCCGHLFRLPDSGLDGVCRIVIFFPLMSCRPVIVAIGAPSSLAVQLAEEVGITLVGFLRASSFNVYTHPQRLEQSAPQVREAV